MRWIGFALVLSILAGGTGYAFVASAKGYGLEGLLEKPVSIRDASVRRRRGHGPVFLWFGSPYRRRHYGGGYGYGK